MCKHDIQCMTASIAYEQRVAKPQIVSSVGVRRQAKKETAVVSYNISAPLTGPDNNHCSPSFCLSSDAWATCNFWLHISSSHTHDCPLVLHSSLCSSPPIFKQERDSSQSSVYVQFAYNLLQMYYPECHSHWLTKYFLTSMIISFCY